ncbi:hypothetical protein EUGRSUZ_G02394 [Eucalyptus grandis]|uniref:Uncharacterized protein n=2 Tax=Eucalyptus grandis TaxID=71139 RepID=A0ACC3K5W7_EUCGR|nr:hypothetical protein EUGRSUZ_G02394 [Eucalyptus grandis]
MNLLRIHHDRTSFLLHRAAPRRPSPPFPRPSRLRSSPASVSVSSPLSAACCGFRARGVSERAPPACGDGRGESFGGVAVGMEEEEEDLSVDGVVYRNTLRLVECSMFAALSGLVYFLSNSLSIEVKLLWLFLRIANSDLLDEMGHCSWEENHGCHSCAVTCPLWSSESINLSAYAWDTWFHNRFFMEVGSQLGCFNLHLHTCISASYSLIS